MTKCTRTIIDYNTWERRSNFEFFKKHLNPCWSVTCDVECTEAFEKAKEQKSSFFLMYLYAILKAANEIPELRYRIETEDDIIVLYDKISAITPIAVGTNGKFHSVNIPYYPTFAEFKKAAEEIINSIPEDTDPYAAENAVKKSGPKYMDMILVAANPGLNFSSMTCTQSDHHGHRKPLINVGKATRKEGKMQMPVFISVHHGLCDGYHITRFYQLIEQYLKEI